MCLRSWIAHSDSAEKDCGENTCGTLSSLKLCARKFGVTNREAIETHQLKRECFWVCVWNRDQPNVGWRGANARNGRHTQTPPPWANQWNRITELTSKATKWTLTTDSSGATSKALCGDPFYKFAHFLKCSVFYFFWLIQQFQWNRSSDSQTSGSSHWYPPKHRWSNGIEVSRFVCVCVCVVESAQRTFASKRPLFGLLNLKPRW